jgi:hypothetical protein
MSPGEILSSNYLPYYYLNVKAFIFIRNPVDEMSMLEYSYSLNNFLGKWLFRK